MNSKRTWIYSRTAYPDDHTLVRQQADLMDYAEEQGFEVVGCTAEHASGLDTSRKGLREVFDAVDAGKVDLLLVKDVSRLGRNVMAVCDCLNWLKERSVDVICVDGRDLRALMEFRRDLLRLNKYQGTGV